MDRNEIAETYAAAGQASLSARRAWIEILCSRSSCQNLRVALRKESVDRNYGDIVATEGWRVALRKESVDRNAAGMV